MRKRILFVLMLCFVVALIFISSALADDPMKVSMELSTTRFKEPKLILVSITVTNVGDVDMPSPVTLYYPNGKKVEEFGSPTLAVGASKNWSGEWTVTQKELEAGKITFKIKYSVRDEHVNEDGEYNLVSRTKNFSKKIQYNESPQQKILLNLDASFDKEQLEKLPDVVSLKVAVRNDGLVDAGNIQILSDDTVLFDVDYIPAGETVELNRDVLISMPGAYVFIAKCKNDKGEEQLFNSPEVTVSVQLQSEMPTPQPTEILMEEATVSPTQQPVFETVEMPVGVLINRYAMTNAGELKFRESPGTGSKNKVLETIKRKGAFVWVFQADINEDGENWTHVLYNGREGYIMTRYLDLLTREDSDAYNKEQASPAPVMNQ